MSDDQGEELRYCPACCGPLDAGTVCETCDCMDEVPEAGSQHTPGPWGVSGRTVRACPTDATPREWLRSAPVACAYSEDDNDGEWPTAHDDDVLKFPTNEEAYVNARLIAQAPDMLSVLAAIDEAFGDTFRANCRPPQREALARARAELAKLRGGATD